MSIDLNAEELALMREVVEHHLSHLRQEILHTDHRDFKHMLHERERLLESIMHKLEAACPTVSSR